MNKLHVGTMGWSYNFWVGNFYSKQADSNQYLAEYAQHFNSVEVDSTFYKIPSETTVKKWYNQTPSGFVFSVKFPRVVTHVKMLKDCERETSAFIKHVSSLGDKLGPLLLQLPPAFGLSRFHLLEDFLTDLSHEGRVAVEVRTKEMLNDDLFSLFRRRGVALAWVDGSFAPFVDVVTSDFLYVRWEGDRRSVNGLLGKVEVDRHGDIEKWAGVVKKSLNASVEVFGYFSKYFSGHPPTDVRQFLDLLQSS